MAITTLSSREFNQDASRAKKATASGPVVITDRGKPSLVLMSYDEYRRITKTECNILEALSMPGLSDIDVDIKFPRLTSKLRKIDFDFD